MINGIDKINVRGFCDFCKKNRPLVIVSTVTLFFAYGIKLVCYSIGIDTELFMANGRNFNWLEIGRFGLVLLQKLWYIKEFNPFTVFFVTFCFIWLFTLSWCYIIAIFSNNTDKNNDLIPFAMLFMTSPVWAEQFYFVIQAAETAFMVFLCPYTIYLLFRGFLNNNKINIALGLVFFILMTSVYQGIVPLFICGVFACFILLRENKAYDAKVYSRLCLQLFVSVCTALALYFLLNKISLMIFNITKSEYLGSMNTWKTEPLKKNIINIFLHVYTITIGHIPAVQAIAEPFMIKFSRTGAEAANHYTTISRLTGNALLLPAAVLFIVKCAQNKLPKNVCGGGGYVIACIGVPFCVILLTLSSGNIPPVRAQLSLPFACAFMIYFLLIKHGKKIKNIIMCLSVFTAVYQGEVTAQLFYSDYVRYHDDVNLSRNLERLVSPLQNDKNTIPVVIIGRYQPYLLHKTNFIAGEVLGRSCFEWCATDDPLESTVRGLAFMRSLGINYNAAAISKVQPILDDIALMPTYPDPACVLELNNIIVVKISDSVYINPTERNAEYRF